MNLLKKRPELKLSEGKVPGFVRDIYYDLKERHLLPLVAILVVALVAVPIVLGGDSETESEGESPIASSSQAPPTSKLVVARATPGLRDYRRRLAGRAKDPFKQQYTQPEGEGGSETTTGEVEGSTPSETTGSSSAPVETPESSPPEEGNGEPPEGGQLRYYSYAIDVRVTPVSAKKKDSTVRNNLPEMTMLPSRSVPALTFISVSKDEKHAIMLVSDKVTGLFGDGVCVEGSERCQLLALEPGIPETVVYGADSRTYRIELLKLHLVTTDKLNKAPLGSSKHKGSSAGPESRLVVPAGVHPK
ncbi:MAG TPA: hypothetical protein VG816_12245 [Solirubrobacterales bacterium]|nr:hypothetical protein [Solirubrobacterales bacterium]